jgi:hypothetical protein
MRNVFLNVAIVLRSAALVVLVLACSLVRSANAQKQDVIHQQDAIQAFDIATGAGYQIGTATGPVAGTTYVQFQYTITGSAGSNGALPVSFQNKVLITDIDGDQLSFDNNGTGQFHVGLPGDPFQGEGGPMTGTYVLTKGTGKYTNLPVGTQLSYKAVLTDPPRAGALGTVYVELVCQGPGNSNKNCLGR